MKFFLPTATSEEQQNQIYADIRRFAQATLGWPFTDRRVFSIRYRHNGIEALAQVGERDIDGEVILAIFESTTYVVTTPNRGGFRGDPILVGREKVSGVIFFDP